MLRWLSVVALSSIFVAIACDSRPVKPLDDPEEEDAGRESGAPVTVDASAD
jgi:hypothetical protein